MTLATNIPFKEIPFVDPKTGELSQVWYAFLVQLFNRSGGATTPQFSLNELQQQVDYNGFDFAQTDPVALRTEQAQEQFESFMAGYPANNQSQLQQKITELYDYVQTQNHTDATAILEKITQLQEWSFTQNHTDTNEVWQAISEIFNYVMAAPLPATPIVINYINVTTFLNGWANLGGAWAPARYYKDYGNIVRLSGVVTGGTAGSTIFQLPAGFRPAYQDIFPAVVSTGSTTYVTIDASGNVTPNGSGTASLSFSGITFRAA